MILDSLKQFTNARGGFESRMVRTLREIVGIAA